MICYRFHGNILVWHPHPWTTRGLELFPELARHPPAHIAEKLAEGRNIIVAASEPPEFKILQVVRHW